MGQKTWEAAIAERETQLGVETVARMAKIFVDGSKSQLSTITAAVERRNWMSALRCARDLADNADALCFHHLRGVAEEFAEACADATRTDLQGMATRLIALVEITLVQLRARYRLA